MDRKKITNVVSRIVSIMLLIYVLRKITWLANLAGALAIGWSIFDTIMKYREGQRKFYSYLSDALLIVLTVCMIIIVNG